MARSTPFSARRSGRRVRMLPTARDLVRRTLSGRLRSGRARLRRSASAAADRQDARIDVEAVLAEAVTSLRGVGIASEREALWSLRSAIDVALEDEIAPDPARALVVASASEEREPPQRLLGRVWSRITGRQVRVRRRRPRR